MRYRAGELPVSIGNRLDKSQGRSTSIENNVAPATGKYGMFTVEQKVEEGIPAGAAAPLARLARREPSTMHDHSASRLRENFTSLQSIKIETLRGSETRTSRQQRDKQKEQICHHSSWSQLTRHLAEAQMLEMLHLHHCRGSSVKVSPLRGNL